MNEVLEWRDEYSVGVEQFDQQHRELIHLANLLNAALVERHPKEETERLFDGLLDITVNHIHAEEDLMLNHRFPGVREHHEEHEALTHKVLELKRSYEKGTLEPGPKTSEVLRRWLEDHIQKADREYKEFFQSKAIDHVF